MRAFKNLVAVLLIVLVSAAFAKWIVKESVFAFLLTGILIFFFLFNLLVRYNISFKPYFLSKWNILSSKFSREIEIDVPKELVFEKLLEVITNSSFAIKYKNKDKFEILATSKLSWLSWGENIYIELILLKGITLIKFDSVTFFQIYSWGKNENNFQDFIQKLDESLTV